MPHRVLCGSTSKSRCSLSFYHPTSDTLLFPPVYQEEGTSTTPEKQPEATVSTPNAKAQRATGNGAEANESASTDGGEKSALAGAFHYRQELELEGLACVVKLYDYKEGDLKLNDNAEFVGVLGYDQPLPSQEDGQVGSGDPFQGLSEFSRKVPPPSLAPRLHCICEPFHLRDKRASRYP